MGLLQLQTQLKSLRYGRDTIGGGSSNQPYITKPIPDSFSDLGRTGGPDFLIRGGTLAITRTADDVSRLTKMFFDTKAPNGVLFTAKQNLLSRLGVKTQAGGQEIYLPTSTLAQAGVSAFGLHFYKQGLNPIPIPSNSPIISLGPLGAISPTGNIITYSQVVPVGNKTPIDNTTFNRLFQLFDVKILNKPNIYSGNNISSLNNGILQYGGGPGSILGIGRTNIRFADQRIVTTGKSLLENNYNTLSTSQIQTSGEINATRISPSFTPKIQDFRVILRRRGTPSSIMSDAPDYNIANIETRVNLGNPGQKGNISSYTKGKVNFNGDKLGPADKINAKPLYQSRTVDTVNTNDLVKFRIEAINNDNPAESVFIHFRAFLDAFSDAYNATWNSTKYVGRGEEFYTYNGFTRGININWTVAAQSKEELIPMHQKLNYLASNLTPDYSAGGYMRGPMMRLTVGGYLYSQPGFITSLTYTVDDNSTWEIGINDNFNSFGNTTLNDEKSISDPSVKELPHLIRVTMNYTPVHTFVPRKQKNIYSGLAAGQNNEGNYISEFGPEHYIALSTGDNTNNYTGKDNYIPSLQNQQNVNQPPTVTTPSLTNDQSVVLNNNNSNTFRGF
jgi:hypothetical protein